MNVLFDEHPVLLHDVITQVKNEASAASLNLNYALNTFIVDQALISDMTNDGTRKDRAFQRGSLGLLYKSMLKIEVN